MAGFFKHRNYDDWMEQLFKHEGMCVWSEEEYAFMKNARKAWPNGCSDTGTTVDGSDGYSANLYYNIKPLRNGRIAVGLYTDEQCVKEYPADSDYVESIVGNVFLNANSHNSNDNADYDFSSDSLSESMDRWDSAFDVWHMCHPCVAHDLENTGGNKYTDDDDGYYNDDGGADDGANRRQRKKRKLGGEYSAQGDVFECYDDGEFEFGLVSVYHSILSACTNDSPHLISISFSRIHKRQSMHEIQRKDCHEDCNLSRLVTRKESRFLSRVPPIRIL